MVSLVMGAFIVAAAVWIAFGIYYDCRFLRLPHTWLGAGAFLSVLCSLIAIHAYSASWITVASAVFLGAILWGLGYLAIGLSAPGRLGGGDIKLALICGGAIGGVLAISHSAHSPLATAGFRALVSDVAIAVGVTVVLANVFTLVHATLMCRTSRRAIPHAPSMLIATVTIFTAICTTM